MAVVDSALLLRVIASSAARFPPAEATSLAKDLLKATLLAVYVFSTVPHLTAGIAIKASSLLITVITARPFSRVALPLFGICSRVLAVKLTLLHNVQVIKRFELPSTAIAAHVSAVAQLLNGRADSKPADAKPVFADVLSGAEAVLSRYVESSGEGRPAGDGGMLQADWKAAATVFTIGEVRHPICGI